MRVFWIFALLSLVYAHSPPSRLSDSFGLAQRDKPPVPDKPFQKGTFFYYAGFNKTKTDQDRIKLYESTYKDLLDLLKTVRAQSVPNDIFRIWFTRNDGDVAKEIWKTMEDLITPAAASKRADDKPTTPVAWIIRDDLFFGCEKGGAYSIPYEWVQEEVSQGLQDDKMPANRWMKKEDVIIHICDEALNNFSKNKPTCADVEKRTTMGFSLVDLPSTLFHELIHWPLIGKKALAEHGLDQDLIDDEEKYSAYPAARLAKDSCSDLAVRNPMNHQYYALHLDTKNKCHKTLEAPVKGPIVPYKKLELVKEVVHQPVSMGKA
ncbi:hypothetical protein NUU61_000201 [Penicillium alfredii]|uniref:Peptidase domain-containing protein n=1 Tax=Penicillium alfredii TaxID=1506179 RepID=A0A9W9GAE1_9EURO|nr:uncharacterized protein NUU61_000201 [Penicillium alfredii]KAJ5114442.1 hypothetical protein NUU61_000201 [Penicillium alfredii]